MKKILLFLSFTVLIAKQPIAQVNVQDSLTLVNLYQTTLGDITWTNKTNWLSGPVDTWYGIVVVNGRVSEIDLHDNNLNGDLPPSLGDLEQLTKLDLSFNYMLGPIPDTYSNLKELTYFNLSLNWFMTGWVPEWLGDLTKLTFIGLNACDLRGIIPASLGNLVNLEVLDLGGQQLTGTIPESFGNLTKLKELVLHYNWLSGAIPEGLCTPDYTRFFIDVNSFTFDGLECIATKLAATLPSDQYSYMEQTMPAIHNNNGVLSVNAGGTLQNNSYTWYKDGEIYSTIHGDSTIALIEPGIYSVEISNSAIPGLVLYTDPVAASGPFAPGESVLAEDSLALINFYNSTSGTQWTNNDNWLSGSVKTWYGITVSGNRVTGISLADNNLSGYIPDSISLLNKLNKFDISSNEITGSIPVVISTITSLYILNVSHNNLYGKIPTELGNLKDIRVINLSHNNFTDTIPASLGNFRKLQELDFSFNELTGTIPATFNFWEASFIFLSNNQLHGPIPFSLCPIMAKFDIGFNQFNYDGMECLDFHNNGYTNQKTLNITAQNPFLTVYAGGSLQKNTYKWYRNNQLFKTITGDSSLIITKPGTYKVEVTNVSLPALTLQSNIVDIPFVKSVDSSIALQDSLALVDLYNSTNGSAWTNKTNWLNGDVRTWHGVTVKKGRVTIIVLRQNNLSGTLPATLNSFSALLKLDVSSNKISGTIPVNIGQVKTLRQLFLSRNKFSGAIPREIGDLPDLIHLVLHENSFTSIPGEIGNLRKLKILNLGQNNFLNKPIPPEIGNLTNLYALGLSRNIFAGTLPASFGNLVNLKKLDLFFMNLNGPLPDLSALTLLEHVDMSANHITGEIPSYMGNMHALKFLNLGSNEFEGPIPSTFSNLTNMEQLLLRGNKLTGDIPAWIGNFTKLKALDLSENGIAGEIPASFANLTNLTSLFLSAINIGTEIPATLAGLTQLKQLGLNGSGMKGTIPEFLSDFTNLEILFLDNNKLTGNIPSSWANLTKMKILLLSSNQLEGPIPPGICAFPRLAHIGLSFNKFTFDGMECIHTKGRKLPYYNYTYGDQANLKLNKTENVLSVSAGGTLANNTYTWYKDNSDRVFKKITGDSTLSITQPGSYWVVVSNTIAKKLILRTDTVSVSSISNREKYLQNQKTEVHTSTPVNVQVWPNPASNNIYLKGVEKASKITIYSLSGQEVKQWQNVNAYQPLNVSSLQKGMYLVKVVHSAGGAAQLLLIK